MLIIEKQYYTFQIWDVEVEKMYRGKDVLREKAREGRNLALEYANKLRGHLKGINQKVDNLSLRAVESFMSPAQAEQQLVHTLALTNNSVAQLSQPELDSLATLIESQRNSGKNTTHSSRRRRTVNQGDKELRNPNVKRAFYLLLLLLGLLAACATPPVTPTENPEPAPTTIVTQAPVVEASPAAPAPTPSPESENPEEEETVPMTETEVVEEEETVEPPVEEEPEENPVDPEVTQEGTPIPEATVIEQIVALATETPTPNMFENSEVVNLNNYTSFVVTSENGAFVLTREPDGDYSLREFPEVNNYTQEADGSVVFKQDSEAKYKLERNPEGAVTVTPVALEVEPEPVPTPEEEGTTEAPIEPGEENSEETPTSPVENPFSREELPLKQFPLSQSEIGTAGFQCKVEDLVTEEIDLGGGFLALLSARCWYLDATNTQQNITIPLAIKSPDGRAVINGFYYDSFDWDQTDANILINIIRIQYWQAHQEEYDSPETWINGGDGNGVDFGTNDMLTVSSAANYSSQIYNNPGYGEIANFGKAQRHSLYTEASYRKFLTTGNPSDLEKTAQAEDLNLPGNYFWNDTIFSHTFKEDIEIE